MMLRALELAARGVGLASPGPLVGCVIVNGREITGEGFYDYQKVKHAETLALEQAGERAQGATAYISLEPHAHRGRTPPCTDALIKAFSDYVAKDATWKALSPSLDRNRAFIQSRLRFELSTAAYGSVTAVQVLIKEDSQVAKAIEATPRARDLAMAAMRARMTQP